MLPSPLSVSKDKDTNTAADTGKAAGSSKALWQRRRRRIRHGARRATRHAGLGQGCEQQASGVDKDRGWTVGASQITLRHPQVEGQLVAVQIRIPDIDDGIADQCAVSAARAVAGRLKTFDGVCLIVLQTCWPGHEVGVETRTDHSFQVRATHPVQSQRFGGIRA